MKYQEFKARYLAALRRLDPRLSERGAEAVLEREELEVDDTQNVLFVPSPEELAISRFARSNYQVSVAAQELSLSG